MVVSVNSQYEVQICKENYLESVILQRSKFMIQLNSLQFRFVEIVRGDEGFIGIGVRDYKAKGLERSHEQG